ncbi:MAG TPA: ribonuclease HII [Anaerolineae bacterium]|nr:ribonuclease HII [Anaerolineae bacterium]
MESGPSLERELALRRQGYRAIAGLDEVGRGSWAGPVVACAAMLPVDSASLADDLAGIRDSKRLSPRRRTEFHHRIRGLGVPFEVGVVSAPHVDHLGIVAATKLAMSRALDRLPLVPDYLLVDGFPLLYRDLPHEGIIRGDDRSVSIAAASIVAKVVRDGMMVSLDRLYPGYGFARHKGYGTPQHREALYRKGPCPIHRLSYAPMRLMRDEGGREQSEVRSRRSAAGVGRLGEELASRHLEERGYVVCETNYRCAVGEMDIVALDGECLAFVEVRTRRSKKFGLPVESITKAKQQKLIEVAETYLQEHGSSTADWRIDVVSVQMSPRGTVEHIDLIKNAVEG